MNAHRATKDLEAELCRYTGAKYAVTTNSCSSALLLAVKYHLDRSGTGPSWLRAAVDRDIVQIPKRTYVSVPMSVVHAGGKPEFTDEEWIGSYQLKPYPVFDSARWFTSGLFGVLRPKVAKHFDSAFVCVSFHASKTLADTQGGAILHDCDEADAWFRRMRFDGRTEGVPPAQDDFREIGYHAYLSPDTAARLLWKLASLPPYNAPLPNSEYPDLSTFEIFR